MIHWFFILYIINNHNKEDEEKTTIFPKWKPHGLKPEIMLNMLKFVFTFYRSPVKHSKIDHIDWETSAEIFLMYLFFSDVPYYLIALK